MRRQGQEPVALMGTEGLVLQNQSWKAKTNIASLNGTQAGPQK